MCAFSCRIPGVSLLTNILLIFFFFLHQVICLVSETDKRNWQVLPREKYPKPLIFHDGRLSFRPTPLDTLVMIMWVPLGFVLFISRVFVTLALSYELSYIMLSLLGMRATKTETNSSATPIGNKERTKGMLYVCNHRTLLDPVYVSLALKKPVTAATYSVSRLSELISPIKTFRLTRNKEEDEKMMEKQLSQGGVVICPEGTTCREPYLLRFSPLFAETTDHIVPIAIDLQVSMFYGTTARGFKFLDPIFFLMNPTTFLHAKILEKLPENLTCGVGGKSKFEIANYVQTEIGKAFGYQCTNLTRKEKYMFLTGNEGKIQFARTAS